MRSYWKLLEEVPKAALRRNRSRLPRTENALSERQGNATEKEKAMKRTLMLTGACILAASWVGAAHADRSKAPDSVEFKIAEMYKPGLVTRYRVITKAVGSMKMFDPIPEQKFAQTMEQELVIRCTQVNPDKSAVLELTMPRIRMDMNFGGMRIAFDSQAPASTTQKRPGDNFVAALFRGMTKIKITCITGPDGLPKKVEGFDEGIDELMKEIARGDPSPMGKKMLDQMRDFLSDDMMLEQMKSHYRVTPLKRRLQVGDTWQVEWQQMMGVLNMLMQGKGDYELLGIEEFRGRQCAKIRTKESFQAIPTPERTKTDTIFDRMDLRMTSSGGEGIAYVDCRTADIVQYRQTQRMTIEVGLKPDAQAEDANLRGGFGPMVQKLNNSVTVELIEDGEASGDAKAPSAAPRPAGDVP